MWNVLKLPTADRHSHPHHRVSTREYVVPRATLTILQLPQHYSPPQRDTVAFGNLEIDCNSVGAWEPAALPHVIPTKMYRKNSPGLRFSMYSSLNADTEKLSASAAIGQREEGTLAWGRTPTNFRFHAALFQHPRLSWLGPTCPAKSHENRSEFYDNPEGLGVARLSNQWRC
jgi:hypothetical protein